MELFFKSQYIFLLLLFLSGGNLYAQHIHGHVFHEENGELTALEGANIFFPKTGKGVISGADGSFAIHRQAGDPLQLVVSFVGYISDTLVLAGDKSEHFGVILKKSIQLSETVVTGYQTGTIMSTLTPLKTESITKAGLQKLACCNLSESFENSASVTVGFTDAVSGAKQVQLLGLSGIYSQTMAENIPTLRGLASTYGWSYTPGSWMESIHISKGASSVVNGYESVTGQVNLEMKKPNDTEPLFFNFYADHAGRYEANATAAAQIAKDLWTGLLLHASTESQEHDGNGDGFMDQPKSKLFNAYNRWFYLGENGIQSRTGIKFLYETREGGQTSHAVHTGDPYKTNIGNKNFTVENKTGFPVGTKEGQTLGIINSFTRHEQNSAFGRKNFGGAQNSFYSNWLFTSHIGEQTAHKYTVGASFLYDDYSTQFEDLLPFNNTSPVDLNRTEIVPGAFAEYTYSPSEKFTFILGMRGDYNSRYGWLVTPRTNLKYNVTENIILRASAGRGFRTPNVIAENIGLLASSRKFDVSAIDTLDIESAWNYGGNIAFSIPVWDERKLSLSVDYFHTEFENQAVVDMERNRNSVFFYNLQGSSFADVMQIDLSLTPFKGFDVYTAFRYNNTQVTYTDENGVNYQKEKPLSSRYRGLVNLSYATNFKRWVFDVTAQINGPSRIPGLGGYTSEFEESPAFPIYFAQVTKNSKRFDVYLGVENMLDYKQQNPILNPDLPFSKDFDSSLIWGPLMGRKFYVGMRLRIGELK
ncbi:MAG: TonB-dependent receptor [Prevotellaceae bacterium]|jgi:outer membrane cobalamin receptor|nr:TonB-dependent receptor [Prevotellaceae bacterium]